MRKKAYNIGTLQFKSKKAATTYTRDVLREIGIREVMDNDTYFSFLMDLLGITLESISIFHCLL